MRRFDTVYRDLKKLTAEIDLPSLVAAVISTGTFALAGVMAGMHVIAVQPSDPPAVGNVLLQWYVEGDGELRWVAFVPGVIPVNPAAQDWTFVVGRINPDIPEG